jgi:hypothetical protein
VRNLFAVMDTTTLAADDVRKRKKAAFSRGLVELF